MKKKLLTALAVAPMAVTLLASLPSCGPKDKETLVVWTFTDELENLVNDYYIPATGNKVEVQVWPSVEDVVSKLNQIWDDGVGIPDVIALEAAVIKDTNVQPMLADLNDIEGTENMYDYTKSVATTEQGNLFALSWQATPGGFFYKKRVAENIGVTEKQMETYLSTWDGFMELAAICENKNVAVVSSITEPMKVFLSGRENSWVETEEISGQMKPVLQLEDIMFGSGGETPNDNCFDVTRTLHVSNYTHQSSERDSIWKADIDSDNCLGYFASCWGLNFDLMELAETKSGWHMCKAPLDYFKGGTWLAVPSKSNKIDKAKDFVKYICTNETFLTNRCRATGDFMNNKVVMNEIVKDYSCEFLDGQNHFQILLDVADNIDGGLISPYDSYIDQQYRSQSAKFAKNSPRREQYDTDLAFQNALATFRNDTIDDFRSLIKQRYPNIVTNL